MTKNLTIYYGQNKTPQMKEIHSYYSLLQTQVYFVNNRIIFAIYFPITHPDLFEYYHLYPIPALKKNHYSP